jgi:hypothetical protein
VAKPGSPTATTAPTRESAEHAGRPTLPAVSVVVATRDRPVEVTRAVRTIVDQRYAGPLECIFVFDQAEPFDIDVVVGPRRSIRTLQNARTPGLAGARNTGILAATGELIGFCDDDDEWLPDKIGRQVDVLRNRPDVMAVGCDVLLRYEERTRYRPVPHRPVTFEDLLRDRVFEMNMVTVLTRRSAILDSVGLVDEELPGSYCEDYDWVLRAAKIAPIQVAPEPLVQINWHRGSFFRARWQMICDALTYLLDKHPELSTVNVGRARIDGQIAFAQAAMGERRLARRTARQALRRNMRELRGYLALAVSYRILSADLVLRLARARGRGI